MLALLLASCQEKKVNFNAEIRPIINSKCISCHGGVKQSGGFGLVFRENALGETENGNVGIVPGSPGESEMIKRITHHDPEYRMPLDEEPLSEDEIHLITRWIRQGAEWEDHWAYIQPVLPEVPEQDDSWANNEIDGFVLAAMKPHGLQPSPQADKYDLVRRVYLDLIGLPPTPEQVAEYINNSADNSFETLVDELLTSPRFGEHWASMWLDLARYADSKGYEKDGKREIWRYRDWVIKAFNADMPFDQFTIEQLAGDLLPEASKEQLIATAFHRNTLNNSEGGTSNEEYRLAAVIDRVNTTWEIWQATTMGCVQCHSHPYDPIKHEEFYSSLAFFNNTADWDITSDVPVLKELGEEDQKELEKVRNFLLTVTDEIEAAKWERLLLTGEPKLRPEDFEKTENTVHHNRGDQDYMLISNGSKIQITNLALSSLDRLYVNYLYGGDTPVKVSVRARDWDGQIIGATNLGKTQGFKHIPIQLSSNTDISTLFISFDSSDEDFSLMLDGFLPVERLQADPDQTHDIFQKVNNILNAPAVSSTPIMIEKSNEQKRATRVFDRGSWLNPGEEVDADLPKLMQSTENLQNRLDLAEWLVSDENPLAGRVVVNRFWAKIFGTGIVPTIEDFGTFGDPPTHPELLDWMAIKFTNEWDWSVKTMLKQIVMSATYQQSSKVNRRHLEIDADNRWLSRSPRVRLTAEQVRDQALSVSGLLSDKMYGPSVMPHQPEGVWSVVYSSDKWVTSEGEDAYRRGLYTFLRRSSPYPSFITFDAATREFCLSRRINTNTPLQALITLNDPVYFEAAKHMADYTFKKEWNSQEKAEAAYLRVMGKKPDSAKTEILVSLLEDTRNYYDENPQEAEELVDSSDSELAAMVVLANSLMNMDEFLVKN